MFLRCCTPTTTLSLAIQFQTYIKCELPHIMYKLFCSFNRLTLGSYTLTQMNSLKLQNHATLNLPCGHPRPCFLPHGSHRLKSQPVGLFSLCSILHNTFSPYAISCGLLFRRPHFHTLLFTSNTRCCIAVFSLCNILYKSPPMRFSSSKLDPEVQGQR